MTERDELIGEIMMLDETPTEDHATARAAYAMCEDDELRDFRDRLRSAHMAGTFKRVAPVTVQDVLRRQAMDNFLLATPVGRA